MANVSSFIYLFYSFLDLQIQVLCVSQAEGGGRIIANEISSFVILILLIAVMFHFTDINECRETRGVCDQQCYNLIGSFRCGCSKGFRLEGRSRCVGR